MRLRQLRAWANAQLPVQAAPRIGKDLKGGGLLAGRRQRDHQVRVGVLVEGLAGAQVAQMRENLSVCPGKLRGGGIQQHRFGTLARECRYGGMLAQQVEVAEDRAAPKIERSPVKGAGQHGVLACVRVPAAPQELAEHGAVKLIGIDRQLIARPDRGDEMPRAFGAVFPPG